MIQTEKSLVFLKGARIVLRPALREDIPLFLRWINNPDVRYFLGSYLPMWEADEEAWVENLSKRKADNIVLLLSVDGHPIGNMGLHQIDWKNRTATTGALIGEKEYWGKGYGSEAKMLLLNYAFNTLNLRKINSSVIEFNPRSYHYSLKCGYEEEGRLKRQIFQNGRYWDEVQLAVFKKDWQPIWRQFKKDGYRFVK